MSNAVLPEGPTIIHLRGGGVVGLAATRGVEGEASVSLRVLGQLAGQRADCEVQLDPQDVVSLTQELLAVMSQSQRSKLARSLSSVKE